MELKNKLDRITNMSMQQRKKVLKWIINQNEEILLMAFQEQKKYFFNLSKTNENNKSVLYQAALYLAADNLYSLNHGHKRKSKDININEVQTVTKLQATMFKKSTNSEKLDKLLNLKNKILVLKDIENLSFRQISDFLKRHHRLTVSHTYLANFYNNDLKGNKLEK